MDAYPIDPEIVLAIAIVAAFTLGWILQRLLKSRSENKTISALTDKVTRLEQQSDAAHQASLELAATHNKLVGEHHDAEWTIRSLKADLKLREAQIETLRDDGFESREPATNESLWPVEEEITLSANALNS